MALIHGGFLPWWEHGSSVEYIVESFNKDLFDTWLIACISAWGDPPNWVHPLEIIFLFFTITTPTGGFGDVKPTERSVQIALRKRPVDNERVERMLSGIVRRVESLGETEVSSDVIGEIVMEGLQSIDSVAYVRFASVYKNFREAKDFEEFLGVISSNKD